MDEKTFTLLFDDQATPVQAAFQVDDAGLLILQVAHLWNSPERRLETREQILAERNDEVRAGKT